jgi:peptidoglycan/LPS O-acetylase OafA/YrhL
VTQTVNVLPSKQLPSLTSGRGIAAMWVVLHHACLVWGGSLLALGDVGWIGVSFFYILSGFVLTWSFKDSAPLTEFYVHRIARIYPVHLVTLAISIAAYAAFHTPFGGYVGSPLGTLANVFLIQDWFIGHPNVRQAWNGVSWSLSAEVFFYVLAPLLIRTLIRCSPQRLLDICLGLLLAHLLIAACIAHLGLAKLEDFMIYHPIARLPEFIYGIAAAVFFQRGFRLHLSAVIGFGLFLPLALYCWVTPESRSALLMIDLGVPAFTALILRGATKDLERPIYQSIHHSFLNTIGDSSYSLYMTHAILLAFVAMTVPAGQHTFSPNGLVIGFILLSILVSIIFSKLVEMPMRTIVLRAYRRRHGQAA